MKGYQVSNGFMGLVDESYMLFATEEEYYDAIHKSFDVDNTDEVVIEPFIKGREFACGILAGKALPLVEIVPKDGLFDYANKYQAGGASEICPPVSLDEETQELISTMISLSNKWK